MKQELRHTSPFLKAVVGRGLLTSSRAPTIQSRRGHQCGVSKGSALRLRLTGSVVQPKSCYDLLTYEAIGSNYLSFVVTSMLVSTSPLDEAGTATIALDIVILHFFFTFEEAKLRKYCCYAKNKYISSSKIIHCIN